MQQCEFTLECQGRDKPCDVQLMNQVNLCWLRELMPCGHAKVHRRDSTKGRTYTYWCAKCREEAKQ